MKNDRDMVLFSVGNKIKKMRQSFGMTTAQLALKIGVSQQQMSRYERGVNKLCPYALYKLSLFFNCSISDFFLEIPFYNFNDDSDGFLDSAAMIDSYFHDHDNLPDGLG